MSQSPLARARRPLTAFAHPPSKLSKSHSSRDLNGDTSPTPSALTPSAQSGPSTPTRLDNSIIRARTPVTPKIHYSPYATSTPPAPLSKSSSIPFDMAASAKAARKAELEKSARGVDMSMAETPKKRFIRRKPLWKRIKEYPQHIADLVLLHYPTSIADMFPPHHLANPISLGIHFLHYIHLAPLFASRENSSSILRTGRKSTGPGSRWDRLEEEGKVQGRGLGGGWMTLIFTLLLLGLAVANALYLFTRFRTYDMQLRSAQEPVHSPHASPIPAPKVKTVDDDIFAPIEPGHPGKTSGALRMTGRILLALARFTWSATMSAFGRPTGMKLPGSYASMDDKIQSLRVWEPPEFCLAFFCAYPPSAPILSYLLTPLHPFLTPLLHLVTSFLLSHLAASYAQLVKDRMVLSAEVMREYDKRFVYKKVFATMVDRGVGTHEAELVW